MRRKVTQSVVSRQLFFLEGARLCQFVDFLLGFLSLQVEFDRNLVAP